jgi:hypothetical protein
MKEDKEEKVSLRQTRFKDADWFLIGPQDIIVGGVGGIGSWASMLLARIGHTLTLFDDDTIDASNMGGQLYRTNQIGQNKASAMKQTIVDFCEMYPNVLGRYTEDSPTSNIVFSCFDNMAARKLMFEAWASNEDRELFVDGRMLLETGMVYVVQKGEEDRYRAELFEDADIEEVACSLKATSHCGAFIASLMVSGLNNYLANKHMGIEARIVQFRTDFELPLLNVTEVTSQVEEVATVEEESKIEENVIA